MKTAFLIILSHIITAYGSSAFSGSTGKLDDTPPNWTGFYSGFILGGQSGRSNDETGDFGYNADNDKWVYNESGVNAGVTLGYNYLFHQFVIGPEIELGYLGLKGSSAQPASPGLDTVGKSGGNFYSTFRVRAGTALSGYLLYLTGGAILSNYTTQVVDNCNIAPCGGGIVYASKNAFVWGPTAGGGIEHLFNSDWSVKLEYLYFNLASQSFSGTTNLENSYDWTGKTSGHIIRAGLNYHF